MSDLVPLRDGEFRQAAEFIYERFGIRLGEQKKTLLAGRLSKRIRQLGLSNFTDYFNLVRSDGSGGELSELLNLITTNHTFFYREKQHFDFLSSKILPELSSAKREIRIWSAGCASGEEAYGIAITAAEFARSRPGSPEVSILATDISLAALRMAQIGVYGESKLRELPKAILHSYFEKAGPEEYHVSPSIRAMVLFKRLNLMSGQFPFKGGFDVIFCRNVMIYFDEASRTRLVQSLFDVTTPGGYLFVGHSESLSKINCPYAYISPATYRRTN